MSDLFSIVRKNDNPSGRIIWSEDQIAFIIKEYNEHHSTTKIAYMFKTSPETIRNVLRKNGQKVLSIGNEFLVMKISSSKQSLILFV